MTEIKCPYCGKNIDPYTIMGDSDWDDQAWDPYTTECPYCDELITIEQYEMEVVRYFSTEKGGE